jgi:hypothetical protein
MTTQINSIADSIGDKIIKVFLGNEEELIAEVAQFRKDLFARVKENASGCFSGVCFDMSPYTFAYNKYAMSAVLATLQELFHNVEYYGITGYNKHGVKVGMILVVEWWPIEEEDNESKEESKEPQGPTGPAQPTTPPKPKRVTGTHKP